MGVKKEARKTLVLLAVGNFLEEEGYPPSYRDLAETLGIAHSYVFGLVRELRTDGLIHDRPEKTSRAITLTDSGRTQHRKWIRPDTGTSAH